MVKELQRANVKEVLRRSLETIDDGCRDYRIDTSRTHKSYENESDKGNGILAPDIPLDAHGMRGESLRDIITDLTSRISEYPPGGFQSSHPRPAA